MQHLIPHSPPHVSHLVTSGPWASAVMMSAYTNSRVSVSTRWTWKRGVQEERQSTQEAGWRGAYQGGIELRYAGNFGRMDKGDTAARPP